MRRSSRAALACGLTFAAAACAGGALGPSRASGPAREPPPPPPPRVGPLALRIVYPPPEAQVPVGGGEQQVLRADSLYRIQSRDSAFVFGTVGRGDATLTVNGHPVPVYPTGAWLAWQPLPRDTVTRFEVVAVAGADTARLVLVTPIAAAFVPPDTLPWIDTMSFVPRGDRWLRPGEGFRLEVRAAPGARVRARYPDGSTLEFLPDPRPEELSWGELAFATQVHRRPPPPEDQRFAAWHMGTFGPDPGAVLAPDSAPDPSDSSWVTLEAIVGADTSRARWPLRIGIVDPQSPVMVVVNDDTAGTGETDSTLAGRPSPWGTYHWFFPNGTVAAVSGRWNDQVRLQLARSVSAWVNGSDVQALPAGHPPAVGTARSARLIPGERSVTLRIPLPGAVPFRVQETDHDIVLTLYGVASDMDWIQYGGAEGFVRRVEFTQRAEDVTEVTVTLDQRVWGYRTAWVGTTLALEIRRPPSLNAKRPLRGRLIALDPGHPPLGATGPSGTPESEVVLGVARHARRLLEDAGATVLLTRDTDSALGLAARVRRADAADADLLVSIHANALPDGVNPFVNHGTSVYYFHPRSAPLARALDRALVREFGYPDLGVGRGNLALARPTWMPAALTEGLFMMIPEQEAVLISDEGQRRYARGIVRGIAEFLRDRATSPR